MSYNPHTAAFGPNSWPKSSANMPCHRTECHSQGGNASGTTPGIDCVLPPTCPQQAFVPACPSQCLQDWWCGHGPCELGKLSSQPQDGRSLSPANVTTEVQGVEMHHEALSEATPERAVHQMFVLVMLQVTAKQ